MWKDYKHVHTWIGDLKMIFSCNLFFEVKKVICIARNEGSVWKIVAHKITDFYFRWERFFFRSEQSEAIQSAPDDGHYVTESLPVVVGRPRRRNFSERLRRGTPAVWSAMDRRTLSPCSLKFFFFINRSQSIWILLNLSSALHKSAACQKA